MTSFCDFRIIDFWLFYSLQMKNCQSKISRISRISWFSDLLNEFLIFTTQFRESIIALALDKVQICLLSHNIWTLQEETKDLKKCFFAWKQTVNIDDSTEMCHNLLKVAPKFLWYQEIILWFQSPEILKFKKGYI